MYERYKSYVIGFKIFEEEEIKCEKEKKIFYIQN